jgi:hypothetical protein
VDAAVAGGVVWINAAGNENNSTWTGPFNDPNGNSFLNFSGNVDGDFVTVSAGDTVVIELRWTDSWQAASIDLDMYLGNPSGTAIVAAGDTFQTGKAGDIPREVLSYTALTSGQYPILVRRYSGVVPNRVQLHILSGENLLYNTKDSNIANPAESANPGLLAVGAAAWNTPNTIENFSSLGPTTDGRPKPDIVGADRGDSATYGPNGFPGTSQASPHVAGLAALAAEAFPGYGPAQIASYLKSTAMPRGQVPNNTWGYGFAYLPALPQGPPPATGGPRNFVPNVAKDTSGGGGATPSPTATRTPTVIAPTATATIPAGGTIGTRKSTWYVSITGSIWVQGEVSNGLNRPIGYAKVTARFFSSSNVLLTTATGYAGLTTIPAVSDSVFIVLLTSPPPGIDHVTVQVTDYVDPPYDPPVVGLQSSISNTYIDGIQYYHAVGSVMNSSATTYEFVQPYVGFYDSTGDVVRAFFGFTSPSTLAPGQSGTFNVAVPASGITIVSQRIWVDADYP